MVKIERDLLATIVTLSEEAIRGNINISEANKLLNALNTCRALIKKYDEGEDKKQFGKFKQQEIF